MIHNGKNYCSTVAEVSRKPCTLSAQRLHWIKSRISCCIIILILKHLHNVHLLSNLFIRNLMKLCRPTTPDMSHTTSWHTQASPLMTMLQRSAASTMPTLCMGNLVMRWRGGSTRSYQTTFRQPSKELSTLNQESLQSSGSTPKKSMRSTTFMSATVMTTKRLRSMSHTSGTQTIKVRTMTLTIKGTNKTTILTTAPAIHLVLDTSLTITTMEGTSTTTRATSQRSQQMSTSP